MSDKIYIGQSAVKAERSPKFSQYSKVVIIVGEDEDGKQLVYEAGDNTGRVLKIENPWGTQAIANDMLARLKGYAYQPFEASTAILDPAAELGDAVTVNGTYSVIAAEDTVFGALMTSSISAPGNDELDEFPYESVADRRIERKISAVRTAFRVETGKIEGKIENLDEGLSSRITQIAGSITLSVSSVNGSTTISITGNGIDAKAENVNLTVKALNIDGRLSASQIKTEELVVGTNVSMGPGARLSWSQVTGKPTIPTDTSQLTNSSGFVDYETATEITENAIKTTDITAKNLKGRYVYLLDNSGGYSGVISITSASSGSAAVDITSYAAMRFQANSGDLYMSASGNVTLAAGSRVTFGSDFLPNADGSYSCGTSAFRWSDIYATNAEIQTSDRQKKKDIVYGLGDFDAFFDGIAPCTYRFIDGHERKHFGIISQDIESLISKCGFSTMDVAAFIKSENDDPESEAEYDYALRYSEFIPLLIDQVQKLKTRVKELEAWKK